MATIVRWRDWDGEGLEHCAVHTDDDGLTLEGVVAVAQEGLFGAHYRVRTDAAFRTREVRVDFIGGPTLHVGADGEGHWRDLRDNAPLLALDGCLDVDIRVTPSTNTLPIRRLNLQPGESRDILAAYVPLPGQAAGDFLPRPVGQRYTRLMVDGGYRYEGLATGFLADLQVDADGLVVDYPGVFRRI